MPYSTRAYRELTADALDQQAETDTSFSGTIVQLVAGDPTDATASVAPVAPATITVNADGVFAAVEGGGRWPWLFDDLSGVHHGRGTWTIFATPDVTDHGVAVGAADVSAFRAALTSRLQSRGVTVTVPDPTTRHHAADTVSTATINLTAHRIEPPRPPEQPLRSAEAPPRSITMDGPGEAAGLEAREISAWFGTHHVLDRVSLVMPPGRVTALIGPSGCGKSTFLRILNRMHELTPSASLAGEVLLDGADVYDPGRKLTDARREIGMVFQKPNPFPAMSIYDNVVASFRLTGHKAGVAEKDDTVESCLRRAGLWNEVRDRLRQPGGSLSGGQQQRLCIARALAIRPRVLLMDEPCSALDPTSTRRIEQTIAELSNELTIVIVTHNMQQAARVSHRCAFFLAENGAPGAIVEHGPTEAMFHAPQDPRTNDYVNGRFG